MRQLVLLRGAAGCGKSTWLKQNNIDQYAINVDDVRMMFQSPVLQLDGTTNISQKNDNKVWEFVRNLVRARMERGELTIVDATHSRSSLVNDWKKLCEEFRYRCVVVEFPNDLDTILKQNASRPIHKQVPVAAIENMVERIKTQPTPNWCTRTTPENFLQDFEKVKVFDFNKYEAVVHFGDIHGCFEPLQEYFNNNPFNENYFYIFVGDYVDRGIQNKEVLDFLIPLSKNHNVLFLEGNHEAWIRHFAEDHVDKIRSSEFTKYTMPHLQEIDKKELREFCRKFGQLALYDFDDKTYFVCHGGLPIIPTPFVASEELIKGVGKYEDYLDLAEYWNKRYEGQPIYQIHGHRNTENTPIKFGQVYNVCDKVEFGGNLRIVTLKHNQDPEELLIKNNTYFVNTEMHEQLPIDKDTILEMLLHSSLVQTKQLPDNVVSINFTRDAFDKKEWNDLTVRARGLFVNTNTKEIVARSYNKFFNYGERDITKLPELRRNMVFPAKAYLKYNGYLGIVGHNKESDKIFVATKSTVYGDKQKEFYSIMENSLSSKEDIYRIGGFCKNNNQSLIFEVVDPINDPHIIEYDKSEVVLLDCLDRDWDFHRSFSVKEVSEKFGLTPKQHVYTFENYDEFYDFTCMVEQEDYQLDGKYVEGFVVEDSNNFMVKFKTEYYKLWKFMRSLKERMASSHTIDTAWLYTADQNRIYAFLKKYEPEELKVKSIIDLRKEYFSQ